MSLIVIHLYVVVIGIQSLSEIMYVYVCDFISRNTFVNSCDHVLAQCEY